MFRIGAFALVVTLALAAQVRLGIRVVTSSGVIGASDITYEGAIRMPSSWGASDISSGTAFTGRTVGGNVRFFLRKGTGNSIVEIQDPGSGYTSNYASAPQATAVTTWGDIYGAADASPSANCTNGSCSSEATETFDSRENPSFYYDESTDRLYWVFADFYNVDYTDDWNVGFTTLDSASPVTTTAYGPWRTKVSITGGTRYGAWGCHHLLKNPLDGTMMCSARFQSGNSVAPWGPTLAGGATWPSTGDTSGYAATDITLSDRYLWSYYPTFNATGTTVTNNGGVLKAARRATFLYTFDDFSDGTPEVANPSSFSGIGSWTSRDYVHGAIWLDLTHKKGVIYATALVGSSTQDTGDCSVGSDAGSGHTWYSNVGVGHGDCPHGCDEKGGSTGPTGTAYVPALTIYDPDDLDVVKNTANDYAPEPTSVIDLRNLGAKFPTAANIHESMGGFYWDSTRNYLFVFAALWARSDYANPGVNNNLTTSNLNPLIHVFHIADTAPPVPSPLDALMTRLGIEPYRLEWTGTAQPEWLLSSLIAALGLGLLIRRAGSVG